MITKPKNTNTKAFRQTVWAYICDSVIDHKFDCQHDAARHIFQRFNTEYNHEYNRMRLPNLQNRVAEWLQGLPFNIAYTYNDIHELARQWHGLSDDQQFAIKTRERIENEWFDFLAWKLLQLWQHWHLIDSTK